ncbi:SH3 domain-containing protein [Streptomyces sp. NPDC088387]|uniref:SH3 domain-containing protein n=1 Tax=Streptomyces sp. NPDC088387 TaxID=3365859 RepID=UPI00380A46A4
MSLRTSLTRIAIATAAGALVTAAVITPATANDEWGDGGDSAGRYEDDFGGDRDDFGGGNGNGNGHHDSRGHYRGVVTANTLLLRSRPDRGSRVIRSVHRGDKVSIFCKTAGQRIDGNPLWYLLTDGTWAWGAARYIDNIGAAPRWC